MMDEIIERRKAELERAKSIRRMYKEQGDMSVANIAKLHEVPYMTAYNYTRMDENEWNVYVMRRELRIAKAEAELEGGGSQAAEGAETEPIKEQPEPRKTKLDELREALMPRKTEPEELPEEPETIRIEADAITAAGIAPVVKYFGACRHCGAEILRKEARYCWNCGSDIRPKRLRMADVLKGMTGYATNEQHEALTYAIKALEGMEHD